MTGTLFAQGTPRKHLILTTATRATAFGEYIKAGDFIYVTADGTLYQSKIAVSKVTTMAYLLADTTRYKVASTAWISGAVAATTITASSTLSVTGATSLAALTSTGTANMAGALNVGTSNNKFTVAAATGNTAIAGVLTAAKVTAPKLVTTATDTTGVGLIAAIGTIMYYNGHFYGCKAGTSTATVWTQLDN